MIAICSCPIDRSTLRIANAHHALVEYLDRPLNHRQEHLLEGNVARYGGLNLDQIYDIITKEAILVVLVVQVSYLLHHTSVGLQTLVCAAALSIVEVLPRRLLIYLAIISESLDGAVYGILVALSQ